MINKLTIIITKKKNGEYEYEIYNYDMYEMKYMEKTDKRFFAEPIETEGCVGTKTETLEKAWEKIRDMEINEIEIQKEIDKVPEDIKQYIIKEWKERNNL